MLQLITSLMFWNSMAFSYVDAKTDLVDQFIQITMNEALLLDKLDKDFKELTPEEIQQLPKDFLPKFYKLFKDEGIPELHKQAKLILSEQYTEKELQSLVTLYKENPDLVKKQLIVANKLAKVSADIGASIAEKASKPNKP